MATDTVMELVEKVTEIRDYLRDRGLPDEPSPLFSLLLRSGSPLPLDRQRIGISETGKPLETLAPSLPED